MAKRIYTNKDKGKVLARAIKDGQNEISLWLHPDGTILQGIPMLVTRDEAVKLIAKKVLGRNALHVFSPDTSDVDALVMLLATKKNWRFDAATKQDQMAVWFETIGYATGYGETFAEAAFNSICGMLNLKVCS